MHETCCKLFSLLLTSSPLRLAKHGLLAVLDKSGEGYRKGSGECIGTL